MIETSLAYVSYFLSNWVKVQVGLVNNLFKDWYYFNSFFFYFFFYSDGESQFTLL